MRKQEETTFSPGRGPTARRAARTVSAVVTRAPMTAPPSRPVATRRAA